MTLVEIMIAMLLAGIVSAFILMITRSQLIAYEQTDQVARMQQNERAALADRARPRREERESHRARVS